MYMYFTYTANLKQQTTCGFVDYFISYVKQQLCTQVCHYVSCFKTTFATVRLKRAYFSFAM